MSLVYTYSQKRFRNHKFIQKEGKSQCVIKIQLFLTIHDIRIYFNINKRVNNIKNITSI